MSAYLWQLSHRFDPRALPLANRHYNRQTPESPQFVPPGRCLVLLTADATALWVTSWPIFAQHAWAGAWVNTLFRNERPDLHLSSELIAEAVAVTRAAFGPPPTNGIITFIAPESVRSSNPGYCYRKAGWRRVGVTQKRRRLVFQQLPAEMPSPAIALGSQLSLAGAS